VLGNDMGHVNKSKNNNSIVRAATFLTLATMTVILVAGTAVIVVPFSLQSAEAQRFIDSESNFAVERKPPAAPVVVSGDNIYVAWWTNNTENGNEEVMFRASNDGGATFGDKMNLSNTPDADSGRVEIAAEGADVIVTWWETNQTSDTPVARISTDGGQTFGPMLRLAANGTISPETTTETTTDDTTTATTTTTNDEEATTSVSIVRGSSELTDDAYQPNPIEVSIDDTITWTNDDIAQHTVTSGENGEPDGEFDSGLMSTGATFEHTFTEAGEHPYFCTLHPNMVGTVIVS
jgi:plastocyanin